MPGGKFRMRSKRGVCECVRNRKMAIPRRAAGGLNHLTNQSHHQAGWHTKQSINFSSFSYSFWFLVHILLFCCCCCCGCWYCLFNRNWRRQMWLQRAIASCVLCPWKARPCLPHENLSITQFLSPERKAFTWLICYLNYPTGRQTLPMSKVPVSPVLLVSWD